MDNITINEIKNKLNALYKENKSIHIDVTKRKGVKNVLCHISGIYEYFICVSSDVNGYLESFTISYADVLTKQIVIREIS